MQKLHRLLRTVPASELLKKIKAGLHQAGEDIQITKRLKAAGETLGIKLLDHMIFNHKGYYSFLEKGEI